jgi:hypothetical protein
LTSAGSAEGRLVLAFEGGGGAPGHSGYVRGSLALSGRAEDLARAVAPALLGDLRGALIPFSTRGIQLSPRASLMGFGGRVSVTALRVDPGAPTWSFRGSAAAAASDLARALAR